MCRAVQEECRERRLDLLVIVAEHVELELVEYDGALPAVLPLHFLQQLLRDRRHRTGRQAVTDHELDEIDIVGARQRHLAVRVLKNVPLNEREVRLEILRRRLDVRCPRIGYHGTADAGAVSRVHAAADPHGLARLGNEIPYTSFRDGVTLVQALDAMLAKIQTRVNRDPLNPWVEIRSAFLGFGEKHRGFLGESLEVRKMPLVDEPIHQRGGQLVEFEQNYVLTHDDTPCTDGTGDSAGLPCSAPEIMVFTVWNMMTRSSASDMFLT